MWWTALTGPVSFVEVCSQLEEAEEINTLPLLSSLPQSASRPFHWLNSTRSRRSRGPLAPPRQRTEFPCHFLVLPFLFKVRIHVEANRLDSGLP